MALTYVAIATVTVGSGGASSISFSSIPSTYTDLVLKISARTNTYSNQWQDIQFSLNGGSYSTNWSFKAIYGTGSAAGSEEFSNSSFSLVNSSTATASTFGNLEIYIPNYYSATVKSISADTATENNATRALLYMSAALFNTSTQISSIEFKPATAVNFAQYSTATLYGIKNTV